MIAAGRAKGGFEPDRAVALVEKLIFFGQVDVVVVQEGVLRPVAVAGFLQYVAVRVAPGDEPGFLRRVVCLHQHEQFLKRDAAVDVVLINLR